MKKTSVLILFTFLLCIPVHPQETFERVSFGINVNYSVPGGDMKGSWNNSPGLGAVVTFQIDNRWFLVGNPGINYFSANTEKSSGLPDILFLSLPAGLKLSLPFLSPLTLVTTAGIQSNTFIFRGGSAHILDDNFVESEFGFFVSAGIGIISESLIPFELDWKYLEILSSPDVIPIHSFNIKIFIF